jgi:1-acyl-sn-glycerol-3-phosphate acyltransferase
MKSLRHFALSTACWAWVAAVGTATAGAGLCLFPIANPLVDPRRRVMDFLNHPWGKTVAWGLPDIHVEVHGQEHLKSGETFLVCANHQSVADIVAMLCAFPQGKFVSRKALFWIPPLGIGTRLSGYIRASGHEEGSQDRLAKEGLQWLKRGCHVLVFPEGTRRTEGRLLRFRKGPFLLAQQANVRVLPVAIRGTEKILPKGSYFYGIHQRVHVELLEPVSAEGDAREVARRVRDRIQTALDRAPAPAQVMAPAGEPA